MRYDATKMIKQNATIYFSGEMFGIYHRVQVRAFYVETGPWAQYTNAVSVFFIAKSQRTVKGLTQSYKPSLLILDGWGHPKPDDMFGPETVDPVTGTGTKRSKYSAFDPGWKNDFDAMIDAHIAGGARVLHDFRKHNSMAPAAAAPVYATPAPPPPHAPGPWRVYSQKTVRPFSAVELGSFPKFADAMKLYTESDASQLGRLEIVGPDGFTRYSRGAAAAESPESDAPAAE